MLENAGRLEFPFRRYQIQKVWRGERPQEGRFREFTQADIDVVGRGDLPFHFDVEVARVMVDALTRLDFLPPFELQVNNRRLVQGFYAGLGVEEPDEVLRVVDKLDKLTPETVRQLLADEAGLTPGQVEACLRLASVRGAGTAFTAQVRALVDELGITDELLEQGLAELTAVLTGCADLVGERVSVVADLRVARGLDYYTGTVFETRLRGHEALGSICSGGRYDALAGDGKATYPGVGISLGVSRLLVPLLQRGTLTATRSVPSAVLVALPDEGARASCDALAQRLRSRGIPTEVAASAQKYGKQIRYAERRGIPWVWFPDTDTDTDNDTDTGVGHQVKDIRTGDQAVADPDAWQPPAADLRPRVVSSLTSRSTAAPNHDDVHEGAPR